MFTNDFAYVITNGCSKRESERFQQFLSYCDQAFLVLRRKGTFIIALFSMMLSTGKNVVTICELLTTCNLQIISYIAIFETVLILEFHKKKIEVLIN